ncbi:deoxyribose-phosphate aldolase [Neocloeon triangulifer]|uniref:deoxyribose-phosphate aldolase n=1 Tax=Neocloeon triangulifer TaxID=2078957 RepID=UPI00286ED427|nr:deoxyribose-phosphate aldolase [Neocloeon triangulifer]
MPDLTFLNHNVRINESCIKLRSSELQTFKLEGEPLAAWLLRAVTFIDLTTLGGDDCESNVARLCRKAKNPIGSDILQLLLGPKNQRKITTAAVCVYPAMVPYAKKNIDVIGANLPIASVAAGFPSGLFPLETRLREIQLAVEAGATEIDIVVERHLVINQNWAQLYNDTADMKKVCGKAHMKSILAVGELGSLENIYNASMVTMFAGSDFIKTSTGKEAVNATLPSGLVMCRAIRDYYALTGRKVGLKPAGGLRTAQDAVVWMNMIKEELGLDWLNPSLFRIGASGLLGNIERTLLELATGQKEPSFIPIPAM